MKPLIRILSASFTFVVLSGCTSSSQPDATVPTPQPTSPLKTPTPEKPATPTVQAAAIKEIAVSRLFALREEGKALVYDVRRPLFYKLGHINRAVLFYPKPFDEAFDRERPQMEAALRDGKEIVLYCGGADCHDSHIVAKMFAERGIPVSVYSGGWAEWKELGIE